MKWIASLVCICTFAVWSATGTGTVAGVQTTVLQYEETGSVVSCMIEVIHSDDDPDDDPFQSSPWRPNSEQVRFLHVL